MPSRTRPAIARSIRIRRVYDPPAQDDGRRVLVERLWPRGMTKATLQMDAWAKDAAPSDELRRWYGHDPARWPAFMQRYTVELQRNPQAWRPLLELAYRGPLTLLFSARDTERNSAVVLQRFLLRRLRRALGGIARKPAADRRAPGPARG